jgi:hypothetical protein
MVHHDMQAEKSRLVSERIRLSLGLLTPAEKASQEKAEVEREAKAKKQAAKGLNLFEE